MSPLKLLFVLLLLPIEVFPQLNAQQKEVFTKEFNNIADTFEKNLKPYLLKFSEQQYRDDVRTTDPLLLKTRYQIYIQRNGFIRDEGFEIFISKLDSGILIDRNMVIDYFDMSYRNNFPGLDFIFFERCMDELKKLKGQK